MHVILDISGEHIGIISEKKWKVRYRLGIPAKKGWMKK